MSKSKSPGDRYVVAVYGWFSDDDKEKGGSPNRSEWVYVTAKDANEAGNKAEALKGLAWDDCEVLDFAFVTKLREVPYAN